MTLRDFQIAALFIIVFAAILIIVFERMFPYNREQKIIREGFWIDLILYNIMQSFILGVIISFLIQFIDNSTQLSRLQLLSNLPIWLQVSFFLVIHDFYIYWFHKLQHKNKYIWRIHEAHHSTKKVDWLSGVRSHGIEIFINQTVEFLPIILSGAAPEVAVIKGLKSSVWGMYLHSNINIKLGRIQYLINGPEMHRLHHSMGKGRNMNFATKLALWNWLFGTSYITIKKTNEYGLKTFFPSNYFAQFLFAFRSFNRSN